MKLRKFISILLVILTLISVMPAFDITALAAMPYRIVVDITNQIVTIYATADNTIVRQMLCSTGADDSTPLGTYTMPEKQDDDERTEWYYFRAYNVYAKYATRVFKGIMFHSIPYNKKTESSICKKDVADFGTPASHGCIRLRWQDAEFIAKYCKKGTKVKFYKSGKKDDELRTLLYQASYTGENGQTYQQYLGIPEEEGVLGRFSTGDDVKNLQYRLRDLGIFSEAITGEYRSGTINAVKQVQSMLGLEETGIATLELQEMIYSQEAPSAMNVTLQEGMSGPAVRSLQENLSKLRLYDGDLDGVFDIEVAESLKIFQSAYCYNTNGIASSEIQKAVYYEAGKVEALFSQNADYEFEYVTESMYMGRISSEVGIRLRAEATTESDALARLTDGDTVLALEYGDPWSKVQFGKNIGYIKNVYANYWKQELSALKYTSTDDERVYTIGYTAEQYLQGASLPSEVFSEYLAGGGSLEDYEGLTNYATVRTENGVSLNLRENPSTNGNILMELASGTDTKVILQSAEWSLVSVNGQNGYLLNEYLEFWKGPEDVLEVDEEETEEENSASEVLYAVVAPAEGDKAAVYDIDSDDATVLGSLKCDINVEVVQSFNGWSLISYQGHTGYMKDSDLRFVAEIQAA